MGNHLAGSVNSVVFVKDPSVLPAGKHDLAIDDLANKHKLVLLLSYGSPYSLPPNWILPSNVKILDCDLDLPSIQATVVRLRDILRDHGVDLYSRHLDTFDPMPIVLAGACISMNTDTQLIFLNDLNLNNEQLPIQDVQTDWDI